MAETEVESILREIRERVLSQQQTGKESTAARSAMTNGGNGAGASEALRQVTNDDSETLIAENLSLLESYLTTTARAWDRLPPVVSNRSGLIARVELWVKRQLKRGTHWFTWEQVNFNAAAHHALRDLLPLLRAQIAEVAARRAELEQYRTEISAQVASLYDEFRSERLAQGRESEARRNQVDARFAELINELRERDQHLQDEQRVCFKQLALETGEAAVLEDRARRKTETLVEELQRRVAEMEKE
ncbi:MAG: hypothetical protein ACRD9S_10870 [Pyrinomonadaceae bacterium]